MTLFKKNSKDESKKDKVSSIFSFKSNKSNKPIFKKKGNGFVSVDFGESSLKFAVGNYSNDQLKIDKLFSCNVPSGVYKSGHIKDMDVISSLIDDALKEHKITTKNLIGTMESMEIIKRDMTVPVLSYEDTLSYIQYEIEEYLPIDISTYVLQFKEIRRRMEENTEKVDVIVYAFPRDLAVTYYDVFNKVKLNPCILDVYSNGIEKLFDTQLVNGVDAGDEPIAVVDFDEDTTIITILKNKKYDFSRILDATNSLSMELIGKNFMEETDAVEFLDRFKNESIFNELLDGEDRKKQRIVIESIDNAVSEVNKIFQYWSSRSQDNRLSHIYIIGEYMSIQDVDLYFEGRLGIPTSKIEKIGEISNNTVDGEDISKYVNAIAALIRRD